MSRKEVTLDDAGLARITGMAECNVSTVQDVLKKHEHGLQSIVAAPAIFSEMPLPPGFQLSSALVLPMLAEIVFPCMHWLSVLKALCYVVWQSHTVINDQLSIINDQ